MADRIQLRFRARRFLRFRRLLPPASAGRPIRILDLGGHPSYWRGVEDLWRDLPLEVTILNRSFRNKSLPGFLYREGDACDLSGIGDREFDMVHSNSVIEHVGDWARMQAFAAEVSRVGQRYFVQTPNFWFPIEPHFRLPLVHWMPDQLRYRLLMARRWGFMKRAAGVAEAMAEIDHIRLLDHRQMRALFPDAEIERETVLGLTKSWMAIR